MMAYIRKIKCPFCEFKTIKAKMASHIESKHRQMIPEGYTAGRIVFNYVNHKECGHCVICGKETPWNEQNQKYNRTCGSPECKQKLRDSYKKNMIKVYGKDSLLNDEEHQKKMLAGRHISGEYKFDNGVKREYTGSYEKKLLMFLDKILGFSPDDIIMPGPVIEYKFNGETHKWITDALLVPYNLVIEVKDGGSNPNKRVMPTYRAKQVAKEVSITKLGEYNYLRLTDNQFDQLISIIYELKMQYFDDSSDKKVIIRVHENADTNQNDMQNNNQQQPATPNPQPTKPTTPTINAKKGSKKLDNTPYKAKFLQTVDPATGKKTRKRITGIRKPKGKHILKDILSSDKKNSQSMVGEMGLAGVGGPVGIANTPYVVQYNNLQDPQFASSGFILQNDIVSDKVLVRDSGGFLRAVPAAVFKNANKKTYKYVGKNKDKMVQILHDVNKAVNPDYIYKTLTGNEVISYDQIGFDENFKLVDIEDVKRTIINDQYTIIGKYQAIMNNGLPLGRMVQTESAIYPLNENVVPMHDIHGYYAINRNTMRRTCYYDDIDDIVITEDIYNDKN